MKKILPLLLILSFNAYAEENVLFHCIYTEQTMFRDDGIDSSKLTSGDMSTTLKIFPESRYVVFDSSIMHSNLKANYIEEGNSIKWAVGTLVESTGITLKDVFTLNRISGILNWGSYTEKPDNEIKKISNHRGNCKKLEALF